MDLQTNQYGELYNDQVPLLLGQTLEKKPRAASAWAVAAGDFSMMGILGCPLFFEGKLAWNGRLSLFAFED